MIKIELTKEEKYRLERLNKAGKGQISFRANIILLNSAGMSAPAIAKMLGITHQTALSWINKYQKCGVDGLKDKEHQIGRPATLGDKIRDALGEFMGKDPQEFEYLQTCWTIRLILYHLENEYALKPSYATVKRQLKKLVYRWGRPRHTVVNAEDPEAESKVAAIRQAIQNAGPDDFVVFMDESDVHLLPLLRAMWMPPGKQVRIPTPGTNKKRAIFGGMDVINGEWFYYICDKKRTAEFTEYLSQIEQSHTTGIINIVADNGTAHISKGTAKWLEKHPRMNLLFLPKYSPQLNPVEKVWWFLKNRLFANRCHPCFEDIEAVIHRFFVNLQPANILQLAPLNI
jgi:transposase